MTNTGSGMLRSLSQSWFIQAIICLCCSFMLERAAIASNPASDNDVQIQTTAGQLLGEEKASRFQKILAPDEPISWEVYIPENDSTEAPGVFVYVSPMNTGRIDSRCARSWISKI